MKSVWSYNYGIWNVYKKSYGCKMKAIFTVCAKYMIVYGCKW